MMEADSMPNRPSDRQRENEMIRPRPPEGAPPRPATEPRGSEGSARNDKTRTDPATGAPQSRN
jgi:hypothetical protein